MYNSTSSMFKKFSPSTSDLADNVQNPIPQSNCAPSPFYSLYTQQTIDKESVNENLYLLKKKPEIKGLKSQLNDKQPPTSKMLDASPIFNSVKPKNYPTHFYKNKLYLIGEMSPTMYKHQKIQINFTDPYTGFTINRIKENDDQPERINNFMEVPVYLFEHKKWTIEKFRIRYLTTYADNYTFLHPSRIPDSTLREKAREAEAVKLNGQSAKKAEREKPACYFPNELTSMAYCRDNEMAQMIYLFGGVNEERLAYSNKTWKMDFDLMIVEMYEQKGDVPEGREGAIFFCYSSLWAVLYGGYNMLNCQVFSDFYIFNLQNKSWSMIEVDYDSYFTPRINFSLAYNPSSKSCFLFGGAILDHQNRECLLEDMYEFRIAQEQISERRSFFYRKFKGKIQTKIFLPKAHGNWPHKIQSHKAFWIDKNTMLLLGGQLCKEQIDLETTMQSSIELEQSQKHQGPKLNEKIWMFDIRTQQWTEVLPQKTENQWKGCINGCMDFRVKAVGDAGQADMITFGGIGEQAMNELIKLTFHTRDYNDFMNREHQKTVEIQDCELCKNQDSSSQNNTYDYPTSPTFPSEMLTEMILHSIPFVFTAFGQLTSLAVEKQSSKINFHYRGLARRGEAVLIVQDDGYLPYTAEEIAQYINQFSLHNSMDVLGVSDKKYKAHQTRLNGIMTFCNRLKMAGLRFGHELFWVACNAYNQILVYWLEHKVENPGPCQTKVYKSNFYAIDQTTMEILPQFSPEVKKKVEGTFGTFLKEFYKGKKTIKSIIKILELRKVKLDDTEQLRHELTADFRRNNILCNYNTVVKRSSIFPRSLVLLESIDVNLKAYLSMYFLQRQIKIFLKTQLIGQSDIPVMTKPQNSENQTVQTSTADNPASSRKRSNFFNSVQEYVSSHKNKEELPLPELPQEITLSKFQEVNFQFMLPKIDEKIEKGELIEVELDCFGEFDCKIIEVYYWMGRRNANQIKDNNVSDNSKPQLEEDDLLYSNGLLIYHKGQLIKRYKHSLGMLLLNQNSRPLNKSAKINPKNLDQYYSSLNQYNTRLFGLIQVNDKYITNVSGTDFLNEELLQRLYERIEHVSTLYEKMYGNWNGTEVGKIPLKEVDGKRLQRSEGDGLRIGRKKTKLNQDTQKQDKQE